MTPQPPYLLVGLIRRECEAALEFTDGMTRDEFLNDPLVQHAAAMCVVSIGEYASRLTQSAPDFVAANPQVPWVAIVGMRNRIAHGYFGLDFSILWDTVRGSLPELLSKLPNRGA